MKKLLFYIFVFLCLTVSISGFAAKTSVTYTSGGTFTPTIASLDVATIDTLTVVSASETDYVTLADLRVINTKFKTGKGNGTFTLNLSAAAFENGILPGPGSGNDGAFDQMYSLKEVILPEGLLQIGRVAFRYCRYLEKLNLPEGLEIIKGNAFALQTAGHGLLVLTSLPNTVKTIESYAFYNQAKLALTSLPDSLRGEIPAQTFGGANVAISEIPEGVTSIGSNAFNCGASAARQNITSITFPSSLTEGTGITAGAFSSQINIKKVRFKTVGLPFATGSRPFGSTTPSMSEVVVWVPNGAGAVYKAEVGEGIGFEGMTIKEAGTVTYDANGGSGDAPIEGEKIIAETFDAAANTFTAPSGKAFVKWNTQADGEGTNYEAGSTITPVADGEGNTESIILYAIWSLSTGNVNINDGIDLKVWANDGELFIQTEKAQQVRVFSVTGSLVWQSVISDGLTNVSLPKGMFVVIPDNGNATKVFVH